MSKRTLAAIAVALLVVVAACGDEDTSPTVSPGAGRTATATGGATNSTVSPTFNSTPSPADRFVYIVRAGDTVGSIASEFGVTVEEIVEANDLADPGSISVGQELIIPLGGIPTGTATQASRTPEPTWAPAEGVTLLTLVDKQHALPDGYVPPGITTIPADYVAPGYGGTLRHDAIGALIEMLDAAFAVGYDIRVVSGYRSFEEQVVTFQHWVDSLGYEQAVRVSAMPGHSEHQLGTAVDLGTADVGWDLTEGFGSTGAGQWLVAHGDAYGFALSYPDGAEAVTGYAYEPWHFRYIGPDAAAAWAASGLTLNQFLTQ